MVASTVPAPTGLVELGGLVTHQLDAARSAGHSLCLVLLDVPRRAGSAHFSAVEADSVARVVRASLRPLDRHVRLGGTRHAMLLGTPLPPGRFADRLRILVTRHLAAIGFDLPVNVAVAWFDEPPASAQEVIDLALSRLPPA